MRNFLLFAAALSGTLFAGAQKADGHLKYYQQGKSWTYVTFDPYMPEVEPFYTKTTVCGDTVVNGKNAFRIHTVNMDGTTPGHYSAGYEEEGIVYELNESTGDFEPILDFNLHVGDKVGTDDSSVTVVREKETTIDGEASRVLIFNYGGCWVEGIGAPSDSDYMGEHEAPIGYVTNMTACYQDDRCIFTAEDFKKLTRAPLIREDRVYEYFTASVKYNDVYWQILQYTFDGLMQENGCEYHVFNVKKGWQCHMNVQPYTWEEMSKEELGHFGFFKELIREEDDCLYTFVSKYDTAWTGNGSALTYDFNLTEGETAPLMYGWQGHAYSGSGDTEEFNVKVVENGTVVIDGEECRYYDFIPALANVWIVIEPPIIFRAIEGIGTVQVDPNSEYPATGTMAYYNNPYNPLLNGSPGFILNRVYNADGEEIFTYYDFPLPPGTGVEENMSESRRPVYDGVCVTASGHLAVSDMQGRVVAVAEGDGAKVTTAGWTPGIYVAVATDSAGRTSTVKFVVK